MNTNIEVLRELDELVEAARLLGVTQAKKGFGCHTDEDSRFERAMYESIDKRRAAMLAAVDGPDTQSAEIEALRAEVDEAREFRDKLANAIGNDQLRRFIEKHGEPVPLTIRMQAAEARAELLAEALRVAREYVVSELAAERDKFAGYEHCSNIASIEADLAKIDAALSKENSNG